MALRSGLSLYCYTLPTSGAPVVREYSAAVTNLTFTTVAPGGFGELHFVLRVSDSRIPRPELGLFARVALMAGPDCLWLGEVTDPAQIVDTAERYEVGCLGMGNALRDNPLTTSFTNVTGGTIITNQYSAQSAYLPIDSDLSQVLPDAPGALFSPSYVARTFEEVIGDVCQLEGDYQWGVWAYPAQPLSSHFDAAGFPKAQLQVHLRDTATTHYTASYANRSIVNHQITPSAERAYNVIKVGYYDPASGFGIKTATDSRLNGDGTQGTAPFRRRVLYRDLSGISTINATQAQNLANLFLALYKNVSNKIGVQLRSVSDSYRNPLDLWRVQADRNIYLPELAPRGATLPTTATASVNQFYIVKSTYQESESGEATLHLECDNFLDAAEIQIARLQLIADQTYRNRATTGVTQAAGAPEMGQCGARMNNVAAGLTVAVWQPFRAIMQNVPTSITLNVTSSTNAGSIAAVSITAYGFVLQWVPATSGNSLVFATYQTVGN